MLKKINHLLSEIKQKNPLILNITNDVTMDFVANGLLSLGASPVMSQSEKELDELIKIANAVVINIGTLNDKFVLLCERACSLANQLKKPIILDPVGAGATAYRTNTCLKLIKDYDIAIIRGNASEILSLSGSAMATKGVDSTLETEQAIESAKMLAVEHQLAIVMSGKTDVIIDADLIQLSQRGSSMMPTITGTGCLFTAVVAAFHAVEKNRWDSNIAATIFYGICGEIAEQTAKGPGSFKMNFLDALATMLTEGQYERN